jgi:hypothetical protein
VGDRKRMATADNDVSGARKGTDGGEVTRVSRHVRQSTVLRYQSDVPPDGEEVEAWPSRAAWSALMTKGCVAGTGVELDDAPGVL